MNKLRIWAWLCYLFIARVDPLTLFHTTWQVVEKLIRGLAMEDSRNMFALFEHNDTTDKAIESRSVVADILAKFEKWVR